jgi:hypothetical protein
MSPVRRSSLPTRAAVCVLGDELGMLVGLGALELRTDRMDRGARS